MSAGGTAERLAAAEADGAADCGPGSAERQFQRVVRSLSPACLEAFEADRTAGAMRRRRRAQGWLRSVRLVRWIGQVNAKGLAPTARSVLEQAGRPHAADPAGGGGPVGSALRATEKQWLRRWARRHGVVRGRFKQGPGLTLETLRGKALGRLEMWRGEAPKMGPVVAKYGVHSPLLWYPLCAQKMGTISGPLSCVAQETVPAWWAQKRAHFSGGFPLFRPPPGTRGVALGELLGGLVSGEQASDLCEHRRDERPPSGGSRPRVRAVDRHLPCLPSGMASRTVRHV
jgi:hypothetical protein